VRIDEKSRFLASLGMTRGNSNDGFETDEFCKTDNFCDRSFSHLPPGQAAVRLVLLDGKAAMSAAGIRAR